MSHKNLKGELRELFVSNVLEMFLTSQFNVGSGIIVNHRGDQSRQMDVVIYDNRILPPFINRQHLAVFPAESVVATIEVKSRLDRESLTNAEDAAKDLRERIYAPNGFIWQYFKIPWMHPISTAFGYYGNGAKELADQEKAILWLTENIKYLGFICLANKYSWIKMREGWVSREYDPKTHEEIKRFFAVLLDNIRTMAETRLKVFAENHWDWFGVYMRDQNFDFSAN